MIGGIVRSGLVLFTVGCLGVGFFAGQAAGQCGGQARGQGAGPSQVINGDKVRVIHPPGTLAPFPLDTGIKAVPQLTFLEPEAMSKRDRDLLEASENEIARRAEIVGFRLDGLDGLDSGRSGAGNGAGGSWGYEQAVCPVFPEHLVVEYSRVNGAGDVSLFTAVVPREDGHVRVIPAQRRSYSLFTPVSKNELTINDFNHMVKEEGTGVNPDWLTLGLCYVALAHGHVRAALKAKARADEVYPMTMPALLTVGAKGGAEVRFGEVVPNGRAHDWVLTFQQSGRLLKVRHVWSNELYERPVAQRVVVGKGAPVKQTVLVVPAVP